MQKLTSLIGGTVMVFIQITFRVNMPLACCLGLCADLTTCKLLAAYHSLSKTISDLGILETTVSPSKWLLIEIAQTLTA